ncbi:MAG: dienelactone hydrolase family protein [Candidatus Baltobacteraceae bacterium]
MSLKRNEFVGIAAGGAVLAGRLNASAEPSLQAVPENDPSIVVSRVHLPRDGYALPAYAAQPKDANAATPGVVVVLHIWGVDESIRDTVRRFAKAGFAAIAPDLYARQNPPDGDASGDYKPFIPIAQALVPNQVDGDLRAGALWLKQAHPQSKVGVTGFCMGGAIALRQAVNSAHAFSGVAAWYGKVAGIDPAKIRIPVAGNYGEKDTGIPADEVRAFAGALTVPNDIVEYPAAGHGFFDRTRASWVPSAAADAWARTIAFFAKYLRA